MLYAKRESLQPNTLPIVYTHLWATYTLYIELPGMVQLLLQ